MSNVESQAIGPKGQKLNKLKSNRMLEIHSLLATKTHTHTQTQPWIHCTSRIQWYYSQSIKLKRTFAFFSLNHIVSIYIYKILENDKMSLPRTKFSWMDYEVLPLGYPYHLNHRTWFWHKIEFQFPQMCIFLLNIHIIYKFIHRILYTQKVKGVIFDFPHGSRHHDSNRLSLRCYRWWNFIRKWKKNE